MTVGMIALATSCDKEPEGEVAEVQNPGEIPVVKALVDLEEGTQLTSENIVVGYAREEDVPINAIRELDVALEQYTKKKIYAGEYLFKGNLTDEPPVKIDANGSIGASYIVVSAYIEEGADATAVIQQIVDNNPGRTIYFPDGTYTISAPIKTSADPAKAVSFRMSAFARIVAADSWSGDAMFCIGAAGAASNNADATDTYIYGGIIDGNGKANAISVTEGRDIRIHDVSIKNTPVGITTGIGQYEALNIDIDNVDIVGASASSSTGISIQGSGNTITNVRIYNVKNGVELAGTSSANTLTDVHATHNGTDAGSCGFYDKAAAGLTPNTFNMCTSQQFATGFRMGEKAVTMFHECNVYWTSDMSAEYGFVADGKLNGSIRGCKVSFSDGASNAAYLKVGAEGGAGKILYPIIIGKNKITINHHEEYILASGGKIDY